MRNQLPAPKPEPGKADPVGKDLTVERQIWIAHKSSKIELR